MIISQLDQTRTAFPHFSLSMLEAWKSRSKHPIFWAKRVFSHVTRVLHMRCVTLCLHTTEKLGKT